MPSPVPIYRPSDSGATIPAGKKVIACIGQSNADFWGLQAASTDAARLYYSDPRIFVWEGITGRPYYDSQSLCAEPFQPVDKTGGLVSGRTGFGIGPAFAREYVKGLTPGQQVLVVPCAVGSTSLLTDWATPSGVRYTNAVARINAAMASDPDNELAVVIFIQGEADAISGVLSGIYNTNLGTFIPAFRAAVTGAATVPILIGGMVPDWRSDPTVTAGATAANVTEIHRSHVTAPNRLAYVAFVDGPSGKTGAGTPGGASTERIHYSAAGLADLAYSMVHTGLAAATSNTSGSVAAPSAPSVSVSPTTGTTATVTITPADSRAGSFTIEYRVVGAPSWTTVTNTGSVVSRVITGLSTGNYECRVAAVNRNGTSSYGTATWNQVQLPSAPTSLTVTAVTATSADLSWGASTGGTITDYIVQYKLSSSGTWLTFSDGTSTATTATVTGLTSGQSYDFQVAGVNMNGTGPYSNTATATTGATPSVSNGRFGLAIWSGQSGPGGSSPFLRLRYTLTGGSVANVVFQYRAGGTSDPYTPISPTSATSTNCYIGLDPTSAWDVQIVGSNTVSLSWIAIPAAYVQLDIANSTHAVVSSNDLVSSTPSIGTNTTAWTQGTDANKPLYDTTFLSGIPVLACSNARYASGPALPLGAKTVLVMVNHTNFSGYGNYVSSATAGICAFWRSGLNHASSAASYLTHSAPTDQLGPSSTTMLSATWYGVGYTFDPAGGANNAKLLINNAQVGQATLAERGSAGTNEQLNCYASLSASNAGNFAYYGAMMEWTSVLSTAQFAQVANAIAADLGTTLS